MNEKQKKELKEQIYDLFDLYYCCSICREPKLEYPYEKFLIPSEIATIIRKFPQKDRQRLEKYYISFF